MDNKKYSEGNNSVSLSPHTHTEMETREQEIQKHSPQYLFAERRPADQHRKLSALSLVCLS